MIEYNESSVLFHFHESGSSGKARFVKNVATAKDDTEQALESYKV